MGEGALGCLGEPLGTDPVEGRENAWRAPEIKDASRGGLQIHHVCHGIRHAGYPTLDSLASLLLSEFKPKVHGEEATRGLGKADGKRQQRADLEQFCSREGAFLKYSGRNEKNPWYFTQSLQGQFYITLLKIGYVSLSLPQPLAQQEFEVLWQ